MIIITDTREQQPFTFSAWPDVATRRDTLATGDYSLAGFTHLVAVERKNGIDELVSCLSQQRERFEAELARAQAFERFYIIIEGTFADVLGGRYRSKMTPKAVIASIAAFTNRYSIPFLFCGGRGAAEWLTYELFAKFCYEIEKRHQTLTQKGHNDGSK